MQWYRRDEIGLGNQLGTGLPHPSGQGRRHVRSIAVFVVDENAAAVVVVGEGGAGPVENRAPSQAWAAQDIVTGLEVEGVPATGTERCR